MSQVEQRLDFRNNRYARNEFKAGDFIKFGRICYHVRETSEDPILLSEAPSHEGSPRSMMDNTIAEGVLGATSAMDALNYHSMRLQGNYLEPNRPRSDNSTRTPSYLRAPMSLQRANRKLSNSEKALQAKKPQEAVKEEENDSKEQFA